MREEMPSAQGAPPGNEDGPGEDGPVKSSSIIPARGTEGSTATVARSSQDTRPVPLDQRRASVAPVLDRVYRGFCWRKGPKNLSVNSTMSSRAAYRAASERWDESEAS
jgi:hypothetical protein